MRNIIVYSGRIAETTAAKGSILEHFIMALKNEKGLVKILLQLGDQLSRKEIPQSILDLNIFNFLICTVRVKSL